MHILIISDFEGISGIKSISELEPTSESYAHTCLCVAEDINAAASEAFASGATQVTVCDWHSGGKDVTADMLDPRVCFIPGKMSAIANVVFNDRYDGIFFIGAHAMAGTIHAFIDHTRNVREWHDFTINGRRFGEIGILAILAGVQQTPLLLVTGDEAACREARSFNDSIEAVSVKQGINWGTAEIIPEETARMLIRAGAARAISQIGTAKSFQMEYPAQVNVILNRADYCEKLLKRNPRLERLDARTVSLLALEAWDILV